MQEAAEVLKMLGVAYEAEVVSAHRTPERMFDYAKAAHSRGIKVIIAGAGGAPLMVGTAYCPFCKCQPVFLSRQLH
jgi:5-(carboxyamino)imidazole ribonucleotide mutase